jgi:hypothetical protein
MNTAQVIAAMIDAAAPVISAYWTDIAHDARYIADAPAGSTFLWAPYEHGTRLVTVERAGKPNLAAAEAFDAMQGAQAISKRDADALKWFALTVYAGGDWTFAKIPAYDAQAAVMGAAAAARQTPERVNVLNL